MVGVEPRAAIGHGASRVANPALDAGCVSKATGEAEKVLFVKCGWTTASLSCSQSNQFLGVQCSGVLGESTSGIAARMSRFAPFACAMHTPHELVTHFAARYPRGLPTTRRSWDTEVESLRRVVVFKGRENA